jgi:hypothetical protein
MKNALLILLVFAIYSGRASAALLVDESFEAYDNQTQFEAVWMAIGTVSPTSAELSTGFSLSSPNSVHIPSSADGQRRNQLVFTPTPQIGIGDQIVWSFDYWDNFPVGRPNANYASLQTVPAPDGLQAGQAVSLGLNNNQFGDESGGNFYMASVSAYSHAAVDADGGHDESAAGTGAGAFFKLNDTGAGTRGENAAWHNLKLVISTTDGATADHAYYVDGVLAESVDNAGPLQQYGVIRIGSGLANGTQVFFDNMRLEYIPVAVPEVGPLAALGFAGLISAGAVWIRKRRAARAAA